MEAQSAGNELSWLDGETRARAHSEMKAQSAGNELSWLDGKD